MKRLLWGGGWVGGSVEWNYLQPGWIWGAIAQKPKLWVSPLIIKEMLMKRLLVLGKPVSTDCFQDNITIFLNSFIILELAKIWHWCAETFYDSNVIIQKKIGILAMIIIVIIKLMITSPASWDWWKDCCCEASRRPFRLGTKGSVSVAATLSLSWSFMVRRGRRMVMMRMMRMAWISCHHH